MRESQPKHLHPLKHLFAVVVLLFAALQPAWAEIDTLWTQTYDLGGITQFFACCEVPSGGFAAVGFVLSGTDEDAAVVRLDPLGDTLWSRVFGADGSGERLFATTVLENGTIVVAGQALSGQAMLVAGYSDSGQQLWSRQYVSSPGSGLANSVLVAEDGGFYVFGRRFISGRDFDYWLLRCNSSGDTLWTRTYGTTTTDVAEEILPGNDGHLELFGYTRNQTDSEHDYDIFRLTIDLNGNETGSTVLGDPFVWESLGAAGRDPESGDFLLAGEIRPTSSARNGFALRMTQDGTVLWNQSYTAGRTRERVGGVASYLDGGTFLAGVSGTSSTGGYLWLMAAGSNGDTVWSWMGSQIGQAFEDLETVTGGGYLACGKAYVDGSDRGLMWRFSPPSGISGVVRDRVTNEPVAGVRVRSTDLPQYGISDSLGRYTLSIPPGAYTIYSGGPCFAGDTLHGIDVFANENTSADITVGVAHLTLDNTTINVLAQNHILSATQIQLNNSGSGDLLYYIEPGTTLPPSHWLSTFPQEGRVAPGETQTVDVQVLTDTLDDGTYDYFGYLRVHTNSCPETLRTLDVLAVILDAPLAPELPSEFNLLPAFPNPFNGSTTLRFALDRASVVSLSVYDLQGRSVAALLHSHRLSAGLHEVAWNADGLASGLYFARLQDSGRARIQRLLFLK